MSSNTSTLIPGYHSVEHFGPDDEYERDENGEIIEEVEYVTLDVGVVEPTLVPSTSSYRLIGLDAPTPYLQLAGTIFKGSHQELLGTELFFTDSQDESERARKSLVHVGNTEKRIRFREVELKEKKTEPAQGQVDLSQYEHSNVNAKKRKLQSVEEIVGNAPLPTATVRSKGTRQGRKSKGKERETNDSGVAEVRDNRRTQNQSSGAHDTSLISKATAQPMDTAEG